VNAYEVERQVWCNLHVKLCDPRSERLECEHTIKALYKSTYLLQSAGIRRSAVRKRIITLQWIWVRAQGDPSAVCTTSVWLWTSRGTGRWCWWNYRSVDDQEDPAPILIRLPAYWDDVIRLNAMCWCRLRERCEQIALWEEPELYVGPQSADDFRR